MLAGSDYVELNDKTCRLIFNERTLKMVRQLVGPEEAEKATKLVRFQRKRDLKAEQKKQRHPMHDKENQPPTHLSVYRQTSMKTTQALETLSGDKNSELD